MSASPAPHGARLTFCLQLSHAILSVNMAEFTWGVFVALAVSAICIASGVPFGPIVLVSAFLILLLAYRYTYICFYAALMLTPFLGLLISIPTGDIEFGKHAFGGSIDIGMAELLLLAVLAAWALKILFLWYRRADRNWKPVFPLAGGYGALIGAHLLSLFSSLQPDIVLGLKFVLRPVLFCYLAFVALPVNLLRSRRRLVAALSVMAGVGTFAALNGLVSLFFVDASSQFIRRAHPLPMFGVPALGDNHNLLAELMVVTIMLTLGLAYLVRSPRTQRFLYASTIFQVLIGLLTFSRTFWIVLFIQLCFLAIVEYREVIRRYGSSIAAIAVLCIPLLFVMGEISRSLIAQSSNSTRVALLEIAWNVFQTSPWIGGGAGTFVDRVGSAYIFRLEYGAPLDSHGFIQKLGAETGMVGIAAFVLLILTVLHSCIGWWRKMPIGKERRAVLFFMTGAGGAMAYQLFNTNYWTAKMWLPLGLTLAAMLALEKYQQEKGVDQSV